MSYKNMIKQKEERFISNLYKKMPETISEKQQKWLKDIVKKKMEYSSKAIAVLAYATVKEEQKPPEGEVFLRRKVDATLSDME